MPRCRTPADAGRVSVVVPCHNEADSLAKLAAGLARLQAAGGARAWEWVLVDDGSTDRTWELLKDWFGGRDDVRLVRHATNRGIAAAIQTGLRAATSDVVASLDADCTYDPEQLLPMLALLAADVDLVVASPYHPAGEVVGVPRWRLMLSRMASALYGAVMANKLHTYTSCVRIYRRSAVEHLELSQEGFVGIVELVWLVDRQGSRIVECPARLATRTTGQSKMRLARTIAKHLGFLAKVAGWRLVKGQTPAPEQRQGTGAAVMNHLHPPTELTT